MKGGNADALSAVGEYYPACKSLGISEMTADMPVSTEYYNMQGMRINGMPNHGTFIRVQRMSNGKTVSRKVMLK